MNQTFEEYKKEIVAKCKAAGACQDEFKKLLKSENEGELWAVLLGNRGWCEDHKIFTEIPKGITLPQSIGGSLDLSGCDLKGITLPEKLKNKVIR